MSEPTHYFIFKERERVVIDDNEYFADCKRCAFCKTSRVLFTPHYNFETLAVACLKPACREKFTMEFLRENNPDEYDRRMEREKQAINAKGVTYD